MTTTSEDVMRADAVRAADELRRVIAQRLANLNDHDIDGFLELCDPDVVFTFPGTSLFGGVYRGKEEVARFFGNIFQLVGDLRFDYRNIMVLGDRAAIEWRDHGHTFRGDPFDNSGVTVMHFRDGLLVAIRDHLDTQRLTAFGSLGGTRSTRAQGGSRS